MAQLLGPGVAEASAWPSAVRNDVAGARVLMIGAGFSQRRAISTMRALGVEVIAVDGDPDAPGFDVADVGEIVDFSEIERVQEVAVRQRVDGIMTVASDRAVTVVAAVAQRLGLPGIGSETAYVMTNKIAMRERLAAFGVPQPRFAAVREAEDLEAVREFSFPLVMKAADSGGQRGLQKFERFGELAPGLPRSLSVSTSGAALVEEFHDGLELNGIVVVRDGVPLLLTLSDRLRPPGSGFGVGWTHLYPASVTPAIASAAAGVVSAAVTACGLRDGIAFPQLLVCSDGAVRLVEIGARIAAGQMTELVRHAIGVELVPIAVLQALGKSVDDDLVRARHHQPLAIRFLTAAPGSLPTGKVMRFDGLEDVLAETGVVEAELYLAVGETIRPVQLDIDRRGYVLAIGETTAEALRRADDATRLIRVEVE